MLTNFSAITYKLAVTFSWCMTDVIPTAYLFRIHYSNFMSLEGQEYLHTEYPDEVSDASYDL